MFRQLAVSIYRTALKRGFYKNKSFAEIIGGLYSEVGEFGTAYKLGKQSPKYPVDRMKDKELKEYYEKYCKDTVETELADVIINAISIATHLKVDLDYHINLKVRYNELRE